MVDSSSATKVKNFVEFLSTDLKHDHSFNRFASVLLNQVMEWIREILQPHLGYKIC